MEQRESVIQGRELADMRLMALLRELVRDHGRKKAASILGVDRRSLDAGMDMGVLSRRMRGALDKARQAGVGSAAAEQRDRSDRLEERLGELRRELDVLGKEARRRLSKVEGAVQALGRADAGGTGAGHAGAGPVQSEDGAPPQDERPPLSHRVRREYPELVTIEPADDDEEVFGEAWPLIVEWREMKESHPDQGKGLEWLAGRERLLEVELALLEDHGMTLPPEKQPLHGLDRSGQTSWRRKALFDTRRKLARSEIVNWVWRVLTLRWLWRQLG